MESSKKNLYILKIISNHKKINKQIYAKTFLQQNH